MVEMEVGTVEGAVGMTCFPFQADFYFERQLSSPRHVSSRRLLHGMWKIAMSEEIGKAVQAVVERVNQAAARRSKVSAARAAPLWSPACRQASPGAWRSRDPAARLVM